MPSKRILKNTKTKRVTLDGLCVTEDEATELFVYHVRMAANLFEATPDDGNFAIIEELKRQCIEPSAPKYKPPAYVAGEVFAEMLLKIYEKMK